MSQNPLLGNRISLISKKNIRYEGTLYSINESDATVALQDVRSFGTEGREETEGGNFVGPQDTVHPYLLFRGCDIKDLHVHENQEPTTKEEELPADPAILSAEVPEEVKQQQEAKQNQLQQQKQEGKQGDKPSKTAKESSNKGGGDKPRRPRKQKGPAAAVGTGASLLNRKARGAVDGGLQTPQDDFDFESNLVEFNNKEEEDEEEYEYDDEDGAAYEKDDFFDSISCDALDKQSGVDNRLRGAAERNLNTETFGAVALNGQRRGRRYYGGRGRGRGRGGGRGRGRGRGGGRGSRPRENNRWRREGSDRQGDGQRPAQAAS
mmetsp:Transcript_9030/g.12810  ORF Transcript_9030/g.12810 Transcript_9030/m.12810 type:complete len:321 (-) Transcript_9030:231-1193(-)